MKRSLSSNELKFFKLDLADYRDRSDGRRLAGTKSQNGKNGEDGFGSADRWKGSDSRTSRTSRKSVKSAEPEGVPAIEPEPEIVLTRDNLEEWRKEFVKKMTRTTTRMDLDRLILAVDRREFEIEEMGKWTEVIFENEKGKVREKDGYSITYSEEFEISEFERKILEQNQNLKNTEIKKSALTQENGEWTLESPLKEISRGGEAVVLEETIEGLKVAVRVACFDSALFVGNMDDYSFNWHLSKGDFF
jgi:hypothetical protein